VLQIDERNLGKISLGQKALASADAYPDQRFAAVVSYINPGIDITRALGPGETQRGRSAGLSAAGHDGFGRYRKRREE